tara:strand:- start:300 stop:596 length:297 start_codon:yes stop_codon:yes gene_type:complete
MKNRSISSLNDLLGKKVTFNYYDVDDNGEETREETKGIVTFAQVEDFYFYEKWNEPLFIKICFKPLEDKSIYEKISKENFMIIFTDDYELDSITEIIN